MSDVNISKYRAQVIRQGSTPASPGFAVAEGQNPVDPSGSGQTHLPVTIATATTGLSITESQILSGAGLVSQYIRGDGSLADFPATTGGGSSVSYYLNGSVSQGTIGGVAYKQLNRTPVFGAGTDISINADGYIASFITDASDPNKLLIPAGNWNFETYFSASSNGGSPSFYVELYKYDGTTFTLIATSSSAPELIAFGTSLNPYYSTLAVPQTTLALTDRLAIRYYVTHSGRTITLHTEDNQLCQIITTFTTGLTALNGLTAQVQNFAVGTSGTDFAIASATATHTFNLPTASATNRGALSSADWSTFNSKVSSQWITSGSDIYYSAGNVGINRIPTSSFKLDIQGSTGIRILDNDVLRAITITPPVSGAKGVISTASGEGISLQATNASGFVTIDTAGTENFRISSDGDLTAGNGLNNEFIFQNNGTFSGGSGAGTSFNLKYGGQTIALINSTGTDQRDAIFKLLDEGVIKVSISANNTRGTATYFNGGGNVLVGTTSDNGARLQVSGVSASSALSLKNSTGGTLADFIITENTGLIVNSYEGASARSIDFRVANASALLIASTGAATFSGLITTGSGSTTSAGLQIGYGNASGWAGLWSTSQTIGMSTTYAFAHNATNGNTLLNSVGVSSTLALAINGTTALGIASTGAATFRGTGDDIVQIGVGTASQNAYLQLNAGSAANAYINSIGSGSLILGANGAASNHLAIASTGAATFSSDVNTATGFQGRYHRIFEASAQRGGLYTYNVISGGGADYSIGLFSEGELWLAPGGSATKRMSMTNAGAVTFSNLGTGTVTATAGTLSTVSDLSYKIEDGFIDSAIQKVLNLKPRYFYWNDKSGLPKDIRQLGFYAQEVNQALGEEAANTPKDSNTPWGISDRSIIAMLTKAIQELKQEIDTLKNKI